jgi:hypothetical protein|tara:strand:+ start:1992 stop:2165 length:174 start_codon:yes stop_codon:yes gene_type:complete
MPIVLDKKGRVDRELEDYSKKSRMIAIRRAQKIGGSVKWNQKGKPVKYKRNNPFKRG